MVGAARAVMAVPYSCVMDATALPPSVSKVMVYEFAVHLAVRVMSFVTAVLKSYFVSSRYRSVN